MGLRITDVALFFLGNANKIAVTSVYSLANVFAAQLTSRTFFSVNSDELTYAVEKSSMDTSKIGAHAKRETLFGSAEADKVKYSISCKFLI